MSYNTIQLFKWLLPFTIFISCDAPDSKAQDRLLEVQKQKEVQEQKNKWVDSVYQSLNQDQRIGQLFMVAAYSGGEKYNEPAITKLIQEQQIGGLIFMQGTAEAQAGQTNKYQGISHIPLLIGMDAEWGLGMRLKGVRNFPRQMMLGAARDEALVYEMGALIAEQCKLLGVHINFAPDIDINNNPKNPVINFRSFGEDKSWVARLGLAYMKGMQDHQVLACAKHFPGHGDVDIDSHLDLPVISKTKAQLDSLELYPFKILADSGVASVMVAHLSVTQLEPALNLPTTLSYQVVTKLLQKELKYQGLIITDALNMEGVTKYYDPGEVDFKAFQAGNDILLFSEDVPLAAGKIRKEIQSGNLTEARLEYSVKKILGAKFDAGLHKPVSTLDTAGLTGKLNAGIPAFKEKAARASITAANTGAAHLLGYLNPQKRVAYLPSGSVNQDFLAALKNRHPQLTILNSTDQVKDYDLVIMGVDGLSWYPGKEGNYGLSRQAVDKIEQAAQNENVMIVIFGNAYAAQFAYGKAGVLIAYEEDLSTFKAAAEVLSGVMKPRGVLPVAVFPH